MTVAERFKHIKKLYADGKISKKTAKAFFEYPELLFAYMNRQE